MFPFFTLWCRRGWRWVEGVPCLARGGRCGPWCASAPGRGVRLGVAASRWGAPRFGPPWGAAHAVLCGEWGAVVSGDVEEGVEKEVLDAFPQGGCQEQGGRPDALAGVGGAEAQHLLVPESPEVLPYRCGVV